MQPTSVKATSDQMNKQIAAFEQANPQIAEALKVMNMSVTDYLRAMASMKGPKTASGNASSVSIR